jgi:hypothetical protein
MGDVINLKQIRKRTARDQASKTADLNRARYGRTGSEKTLEKQRAARADRQLDGHRLQRDNT